MLVNLILLSWVIGKVYTSLIPIYCTLLLEQEFSFLLNYSGSSALAFLHFILNMLLKLSNKVLNIKTILFIPPYKDNLKSSREG